MAACYLLHLSLGHMADAASSPNTPALWAAAASAVGASLLRARDLNEARVLSKTYSWMAACIELEAVDPQTIDLIKELEAISNPAVPLANEPSSSEDEAASEASEDEPQTPCFVPTFVIDRAPLGASALDAEAYEQLAQAGISNIMNINVPAVFFERQFKTLIELAGLRKFASAKMDVSVLAAKTRQELHDLSQPLAALQGRLQLLQIRAGKDDPQAKTYQELVRMAMEVTRFVMGLHQLHRQVS